MICLVAHSLYIRDIHLELVNGYRVSVTQIRTDLHLLLMSFPSSDGTSTRLDHGQRSSTEVTTKRQLDGLCSLLKLTSHIPMFQDY
jgi:hypothetical protein